MNQSVLLFSLNSAQLSRDETCPGGNETPFLGDGIRHKYDASVKLGVQIYAYISFSFSPSVPKCHQNLCLRRLPPFSRDGVQTELPRSV